MQLEMDQVKMEMLAKMAEVQRKLQEITNTQQEIETIKRKLDKKMDKTSVDNNMAEVQVQMHTRAEQVGAQCHQLAQEVQNLLNMVREDIVADRKSVGKTLEKLKKEVNNVKALAVRVQHAQSAPTVAQCHLHRCHKQWCQQPCSSRKHHQQRVQCDRS